MLVSNDDDRQAGSMRARKDFKSTTQTFTSLHQEQGRQRPLDEALRADMESHSPNWKSYWSQTSSPSSSQQWWQHEHQRHPMARTPRHSMARSQLVERVMATDSFKATQVFFFFTGFAYRHERMSCTRRVVKTEHLVARTFFSVSRTFDHHTHMSVAQDLTGQMFGMCCTFAHLESHPLTLCFIDHSLTGLTHFNHFVPRHIFYTDSTAYDCNQEIHLRQSARRISVWPSGRIHSSHRGKHTEQRLGLETDSVPESPPKPFSSSHSEWFIL